MKYFMCASQAQLFAESKSDRKTYSQQGIVDECFLIV